MFGEVPRFSGAADAWDSDTAGPILLADFFPTETAESRTATGTLTLDGAGAAVSTEPTRVSESVLAAPVGSINANSSPQNLAAPAGLAAGHLLVLAVWPAQGLGGSNTITTPAFLTKITTDPVNPERLAAVFATVVDDPADFAGGITIATSSFSSRLAAVAQAWAPGDGFEWDWASIIAAGPEWNASAMSADTFPTLSARDLTIGAAFTNKGASATLTTHTADGGGTDLSQCRAVSAASGSVSDSVVSLTRGGTGVSFNLSQANGLTYTIGLDQVPVGGGAPERTGEGILTLAGTGEVGLPTVTGHGFTSVTQMLDTPGATWAHRNVGGTYPEMTEYGVRMAANHGHGVIEISCQRTSDGVWFGAHDQTPDRVAVQTTHDGTNFSALTWAQVSAMTVNVGATGSPQPFATLEDLVTTLPTDFIFLVDPKQSGDNATYRDEFLDLVDTILGTTRAIVKLDAYANINTFIDAKTRGYTVATYFYAAPSSPTGSTIVEARLPYTDLPGLNYNATQAGWDDYLDPAGAYYTLAAGKPMWGHVCASQANADEATGKGATYIQSTSSTIAPVGVEAWVPERTATGTLTLSGAGAQLAAVTAAGGVTLTGSGAVTSTATAAGTLTLGGTAPSTARTTATGTVTLAGSAVAVPRESRTATGGLTLAGTAPGGAVVTATGGLTIGGTADAVPRESRTATGGLTLTGSAAGTARTTANGMLTVSGAAVTVAREIRTATGALILSGTAVGEPVTGVETRTATGTLTASGTAQPTAVTTAAGAVTVGGSAQVQVSTLAVGILTLGLTVLAVALETRTATGQLILSGSAWIPVPRTPPTLTGRHGTLTATAPPRTVTMTAPGRTLTGTASGRTLTGTAPHRTLEGTTP